MSITSEITRITNAKSAIGTAIAAKGVTVPSGTKLDGFAALIAAISGAPSGLNEVAYGTFTLPEQTKSLTIQHGMSDAPTGLFIWRTVGRPSDVTHVFYPPIQTYEDHVIVVANTAGYIDIITFGSGEVTISASRVWFASDVPYYWIAWR